MVDRLTLFVLLIAAWNPPPEAAALQQTATVRSDVGDLTPEDLVALIEVACSEVDAAIQSARRFLKGVAQWVGAHSAEIRLARCVARCFFHFQVPDDCTRGGKPGKIGLDERKTAVAIRGKIIGCGFRYLWTKFWQWVEATPT